MKDLHLEGIWEHSEDQGLKQDGFLEFGLAWEESATRSGTTIRNTLRIRKVEQRRVRTGKGCTVRCALDPAY